MADERKLDEILDTLNLVRNEGEVIEIRMVGTREGTVSGYFDNYTEAVKSVEKYNGKNDIYITLNPVKSGLLSRYNNRLQTYAKQTTSDTDIEKIKYILIDLDPVRPSGISSTKEEKEKALELLKNILRDFKNENLPTPIAGDSGNGYHLLLPIDMENSGDNIKLVKDFLEAMDFIYSTEEVQVDRTTYNPARIVKFYGTIACKGDNTEERPHRYSKVIKKPKERTVATREQIQSIVSKRPKVESEYKVKASSKSINIDDLIEKHRLDLAYKAPFKDGGTKYILKTCPWNSDHTNSAAAVNAMMKTTPSWTGSVSQLLRKLEDIAEYEKINTRVKSWARDANVLSRRLKEVKSNLEEVGIHYYKRHAGNHKEITIEKVGALDLTRPEESEDTLVGEESSTTTLGFETSLEEIVNELLDV